MIRSTALGARKSDCTTARLLARLLTGGREECVEGMVVFSFKGGFWGAAAARVEARARTRDEARMMKKVVWKSD